MLDKGLVINRSDITSLIKKKNLIAHYIDLDIQLTPHGFDLTVGEIFKFEHPGALDFSNKERSVPQGKKIIPEKKSGQDKFRWWNLKRGAYRVRTNEIINLPYDLIAIGFSRSSLLRMGGFTQNAVWDAGFSGRSEFILVVENPRGIKIKENARLLQLIFIRARQTKEGYSGIYQEGL